jgi:hypothetical protein
LIVPSFLSAMQKDFNAKSQGCKERKVFETISVPQLKFQLCVLASSRLCVEFYGDESTSNCCSFGPATSAR